MKVRALDVRPGDKWVVPGDIHFDQHDPGALNVMTDVMTGEGVNGLCLVGDTHNSIGISRHVSLRAARHYRHGEGTIKAEEAAAKPYFDQWKALIKMRRDDAGRTGGLEAIEGNHEKWWSGVQDDYPGLLDTKWYELYGELYDGFTVNADTTALKLGSLLVVHGHRARGSLAKKSAYQVLQNYPGQNTLYGHTHRIDCCTTPTYKNGFQTSHGAWTMGHMRDREKELDDANIGPFAERHQQGFALLSFFDRGDSLLGFDVNLVRIHRDSSDMPMAVVGGRVYR